jgi:hypothetical protein
MKLHLAKGPSIVSQSSTYLRLFRRKEPASRSPSIIRAQAGSDQAEVLGHQKVTPEVVNAWRSRRRRCQGRRHVLGHNWEGTEIFVNIDRP